MTKFLRLFVAILLCAASLGASAQEAQITNLIEADFTQFTEGSIENPVAFASYGSGAFSTYFPSWSASKAYQAGGALLLQDGGSVRTKSFSALSTNGAIRVRIKVRALDSYGGAVTFTIGYTATTLYLSNSDWTELEVVGTGSSYTTVTIAPYLSASGILLESLSVDQSTSFMAAPKAYQPTSADGTSFMAQWSSVTGATNYYLDVYSYTAIGGKSYVLENEDCGTSRYKNISDLDPNTTYYYTVRASDGTATSANSNEIRVVKVISQLAAPEPSASVTGNKATISWDAVPDAISYIVEIFKTTTLTADTEVDVISEDFSKVTEGSLASIEFTFNYKLDQYTSAKGWDGSELGLAAGYMVLTPYSGSGTLVTPTIDLSGNDGKFTASYTIQESAFGYLRSGGTITIDLLDADDNVLESKEFTLEAEEKAYSADFTKGAADCRVSLSYTGSYKCFINDVTISQTKAAGSTIRETIEEVEIDDNSYTIDFDYPSNVSITYCVTAVGETVVSSEIASIYSEPSAELTIGGSAAIGAVTDNDNAATVTAAAGVITVTTQQDTQVSVFDLNGRTLISAPAFAGENAYSCSASGVVIVKVGNKAFKVIL